MTTKACATTDSVYVLSGDSIPDENIVQAESLNEAIPKAGTIENPASALRRPLDLLVVSIAIGTAESFFRPAVCIPFNAP